jgi:hypothetical protein
VPQTTENANAKSIATSGTVFVIKSNSAGKLIINIMVHMYIVLYIKNV